MQVRLGFEAIMQKYTSGISRLVILFPNKSKNHIDVNCVTDHSTLLIVDRSYLPFSFWLLDVVGD